MTTSRLLLPAALLAASALAACRDGVTSAPRRVDSRLDATASREIPKQYAWVGDEHNRFVTIALDDYDAARKSGNRARVNAFRRDCSALWDLMAREIHASARVGAFAGREGALLTLVHNAAPESDGCARLAAGSLPLFPLTVPGAFTAQAPSLGNGQPWDMLSSTLSQLSSARSPAEVRRIIGDAAATASTLSPPDAEVAYAVLSLTRGSFEHWSAILPARRTALSLFMQDTAAATSTTPDNISWTGIIQTVYTDASACLTAARVVRELDGSGGWTTAGAGCLISGGVSSAGAAIALK